MENAPEINEDQDQTKKVEPAASSNAAEEPERTARPNGIVATFREALRRVKEGEQRAAVKRPSGATPVRERNARNRDRTKTMLVMVGGIAFALIVFLGLFSSRSETRREMAARRGNPSLGRPERQVGSGARPGSVTPLLNAEVGGQQPASDQLTPEDSNGTSRPRAETGGGPRNRPVPAPKRNVAGTGGKANQSGTKPVPQDASQFPDPALEAYRQQVAHPPGGQALRHVRPEPRHRPRCPQSPVRRSLQRRFRIPSHWRSLLSSMSERLRVAHRRARLRLAPRPYGSPRSLSRRGGADCRSAPA